MTLIISRTLRAPESPEVSTLGSRLQAALQDRLEPTSSAESVRPGGGPPRDFLQAPGLPSQGTKCWQRNNKAALPPLPTPCPS